MTSKHNIAVLICVNTILVLFTYWLVIPIQQNVNRQQRCKSSNESLYKVSKTNISWHNLRKVVKFVQPGGRFIPVDCIPVAKVAIIIPYGNREDQLRVFLKNIHPFLQLQNLEYGIFVVEMKASIPINRGILKNVGYLEASRLDDFNCFLFHDVDLIPEKLMNSYNCSSHPMHMSPAIDARNYKLAYNRNFGGVVAFTREQFRLVNGYPNIYFGWGREDDDLRYSFDLFKRKASKIQVGWIKQFELQKISHRI